jgi:cytochrome c2
MLPPDGASDAAISGFTAFRMHCSRCHAVNGDGGTIGPDLNFPVNPVEHREAEWLRRWIDDPSAIVATTRMPRLNPALPDREATIEHLLAYLEAMAQSKPRPGKFEAFYDSALQHPLLLWLAVGAALAFSVSRHGQNPSMRRYCAALGILALFDAWLTAPRVFGPGSLPESLQSLVPLFFVLAGDARYLLLLTAATPDGRIAPSARSSLQAAGLTVVVPLASQLAMTLVPESPQSSRVMFLIYEVGFVCLTLALLRWHPRAQSTPWLRGVSRFVILYYGLWATADAAILFGGWDAGFLLRVLPNLLYYGGFIAVIARLAPAAGISRRDR